MDEKNTEEATVGVSRRFAVRNKAPASNPSPEGPYHACACGRQDAVSAVSNSSKQINSLPFSLAENSKDFMPPLFGNE
jgi:hypothetical protein